MAYQSQPPRRRRRKQSNENAAILKVLLFAILAIIVFALVMRLILALIVGTSDEKDFKEDIPKETKASFWSVFSKKDTQTEPEETAPLEEQTITTATITATGDILMHKPVIETGLQTDGSYDFSSVFRYVNSYVVQSDYAVANLETTLCGTDNGYPYSGFPCFNCPDEIVDSLKDAGFDMLLTANNHSYDTKAVGYQRTIKTVRGKGMQTLGTMASASDPKYEIRDINGIKVGMFCYTYECPPEPEKTMPGLIYLNYIPMDPGSEALINSFLPANLSPFYLEVEKYVSEMRQAGAEAIVLFIHWGTEYQLNANAEQRDMAQKLCDLGIDVIIGGHPHVVQPVELLSSRVDPAHKTVCLYSMGNAVSNQRLGELNSFIQTAHTEDGVLFSVSFTKYPDGSVYLEGADLLPCWVNLKKADKTEYNILPLDPDTVTLWSAKYGLNSEEYTAARDSYDRTMAIVGNGLITVQNYLAEAKQQRLAPAEESES